MLQQKRNLEQLQNSAEFLAREGKKIDLSSAGEAFFDYANQILTLNDQAINQFSKSAVIGTEPLRHSTKSNSHGRLFIISPI